MSVLNPCKKNKFHLIFANSQFSQSPGFCYQQCLKNILPSKTKGPIADF
jgi:hypothetical protein